MEPHSPNAIGYMLLRYARYCGPHEFTPMNLPAAGSVVTHQQVTVVMLLNQFTLLTLEAHQWGTHEKTH